MLPRVLTLVLVLALAGCGQSRPTRSKPVNNFTMIMVNDTNFPQDWKLTYWRILPDGTTGSAELEAKQVPPGSSASFVLPVSNPYVVDVEGGWGNMAWSGPDYEGFTVVTARYPSGAWTASRPAR